MTVMPREDKELTEALVEVLGAADPNWCTWGALTTALSEHRAENPVLLLSDAARPRVVLRRDTYQQARSLLETLARQPVLEIAQTLDALIAERESQNDPWPEGRLNAGIAWALAEDLDAAQQRLQEAVDILEGGSVGRAAAAMRA